MENSGYSDRQIIDEISTINLLDDKAFKIALSNESMFRLVTKEITGNELYDGKFNYNGEILVTVRSKKIILDSLAKTDKEWVDIEGQQITNKFLFERHLYYWSTIYTQSLLSGMKYSDLIPVTVIVIYKDKGKCGLIEEAGLDGTLARSTPKRKHLRLIAVNSAKWAESSSGSLKAYLYLLHRGFGGLETPESCSEVDFTTSENKRIWHAMRGSCAESLLEKVIKNKGGKAMINNYTRFISEERQKEIFAEGMAEGMAEGISKGELKGELKGMISALYQISNMTIKEIADNLKITEEEVKQYLTTKSGIKK